MHRSVSAGGLGMRAAGLAAILVFGAALAYGPAASPAAAPARVNGQTDVVQTAQGELRVRPLFHGSVMLEFGGKVFHIDPWSAADYSGLPAADVIVVTHT